jgi:ribosomal protein S18 acetylase RimI-like enzyme
MRAVDPSAQAIPTMAAVTMGEAERLRSGLLRGVSATLPRFPDAWMDQRAGHSVTVCPSIPLPGFNGVWIDDDVAVEALAQAISEVEAAGVPCWLVVHPPAGPFADTAATLGFRLDESVPGMCVTPDELVPAATTGLEIVPVGADSLAASIDAAVVGFGGSQQVMETIYGVLATTADATIFEARVGDVVVATACAWVSDGCVGIFNVATTPAHRRRGYGRAVTEHAVRAGFAAGADLAWLQASELGASVYASMGFREVDREEVYVRAEAGDASGA